MKRSFLMNVDSIKNEFFGYMSSLTLGEKKPYVKGDLVELYVKFKKENKIKNNELDEIVNLLQEAFTIDHKVYIDVREKIGQTKFYAVLIEEVILEEISVVEYLITKEEFINPESKKNILNLDFKPFYDRQPLVRDPKNIGQGFEFLNRFLSSKMFNDIDKWRNVIFEFIKKHSVNGEQLILNDRVNDPEHLIDNISKALKYLSGFDEETKFGKVKHALQDFGIEKGIGENVHEITHSLNLLRDLLNSPDHITLKEFITRIPMITKIAVISPHGYFAQDGVLGMPDTGGQVVYILDQVKALEKSLGETIKKSGLNVQPKIIILTRQIPNAGNTTCNKRLEKIRNTKNVWILRVPFRKHNPAVTDNWISRFQIWPYLEEFAEDSFFALKAEFGGRPDLVIGNYSDGNLVSYLLSKSFGVTQCCIAHALEKSKYLFSDLYWNDLDPHYNFSIQFTADLLAMNASDFQITSTFQEIAGTDDSVGQYESHKHFTLPGLYRVENGIDLSHTKFNILSPGVNENIYFPYSQIDKRNDHIKHSLTQLLFENKKDDEVVGTLKNPSLIPIFSMARLDSNKNLTSLVRWFGKSKELQKIANLIIVAGNVDVSKSSDKEEIEEIHKMYNYIDEYNLKDKIRWIGKLFRKDEAGEVYRLVADKKGVFIQPGLFEGFGLTVIEAMSSGLPVIATKYGGPLEIIQNNINGYHIDPVNDEQSIKVIFDFVSRINKDKNHWQKISQNSVKRVEEAYTWKLYADKLLSLAKIYGFWKYSMNIENKDMEAYLEIIYQLLFKPRAEKLLAEHDRI